MVTPWLFLAACLQTEAPTLTKADGLQIAEFKVPQGSIRVYLPDDIRAGDTISGSVLAIPNGKGAEETKSAEATVRLATITIAGSLPARDGDTAKFVIPATSPPVVKLIFTIPGGKPGQELQIPLVTGGSPDSPGPFQMDPVIAIARPITVHGNFDGDMQNTKCSVPGTGQAFPLAESPRKCVVAIPPGDLGPVNIHISDGDQSATLPSHQIQVRLTSPKRILLKGERTTVKLEVLGLNGLSEEAYPIPIEVRNLTPQVIRIEGISGNTLAKPIHFQDVKGGKFEETWPVNANLGGTFTIQAVVFAVSIHDMKGVMDTKMFNTWVAGMIEVYKAKIAAMQAELDKDKAAGKKNPGLEANIKRKQGILDVLEANKRTTKESFGVAKTVVDKVLADDTFFAVAADLISTAADMLGYSSLPIPGIGAVIRGVKVLATKMPKALAALETAEKLLEEYTKLTDAQEKAKKLQEIKETMDLAKGHVEKEE